jgi:integrase/recombinase XerD
MIGKRAKILAQAHVKDLLFFAQYTRHPIRNQVIVLLSLKAGLRAAEIANLSWDMVVDPTGEIATTLELRDHVAKNGSGRVIPIHPDLREALMQLRADHSGTGGAVIQSERGGPMRPIAIVCWFARAYRAIGLTGCRRILAAEPLLPGRRGSRPHLVSGFQVIQIIDTVHVKSRAIRGMSDQCRYSYSTLTARCSTSTPRSGDTVLVRRPTACRKSGGLSSLNIPGR